ncbi:MAG: FAD-dependent thymidylate synthase [Candidatus Omnitrophica bacterium]|nr:FAD-dependent thymidylate synthase [Candidatus Omnitrophota bacterium]
MPETTLNVNLLDKTENALALIYSACRQCYSSKGAFDIFERSRKLEDPEKISEFIRKVIASGHESPLEHIKFTFAVEGVSRALTHQLVRHRLASYSQQSQRYVKEDAFDYIMPPIIKRDERLKQRFLDVMKSVQDGYNDILATLKERGIEGEIANQDARFLLPNAAETKIVITMNCRELKHFFGLRCCTRAQWEIRALADKMLEICKRHLPEVFSALGPKCEELKYCPEGKQYSCGKYPVKEEFLNPQTRSQSQPLVQKAPEDHSPL